MYKNLFRGEHRLVNTNLNDFSDRSYIQTGFKDSGILCSKCDNELLSKLERYASNTIFGNNSKTQKHPGDAIHLPYTRYSNLDYTVVKLFFLSLLWKSHISKNSFFKEINLGPKYAEKIRKMLLENDAGNEDEFEVLIIQVCTDGTRPSQSLIEPRKLRQNGNTSYVFLMDELMYHFNVSPYNKEDMYKKGLIKRDGILDIPILTGTIAREYFDSFLGKKILMKGNVQR